MGLCGGNSPGEINDGATPGAFTFFPAAMADDGRGHGDGWGNGGGDGGWGRRDGDGGREGRVGPDGDGGRDGGSSRGSDIGRESDAHASGGDYGLNSGNVSFDAGRNMMKFDFKIGGGERRGGLDSQHHELEPEHHWRHEHDFEFLHDRERRKLDHDLRHFMDGWKHGHPIEAPAPSIPIAPAPSIPMAPAPSIAVVPQSDTTVDSLASRDATATSNGRSAPAQQNDRAAVDGNARFTIGNSTFMPNEVLAVGLDPASLERAKALGFRADPQAVVSEATNYIITQFTVPPGLGAVRGRVLLTRELPGRRFELNKVYRLYRAAMSEEKPGLQDKDKPAPPPGKPSRCGEDRCFARQAIGWKETLAPCARGLKVGVIDTDIDEAHPAFSGRTIHRFDFSPDGHGVPPNWHGTAVLSLLAGSPLGGAPGLIPDAEFFAANIFFADERGEMAADTLSLLKALDWVKTFGVKLVNMSFSGPRDELVAEAIENLSKKGIVFVAAAGNEGPAAAPSYPAAYPQVIAVTAVTKDLRNYRYANRGDHIDVAAPGVNIWTAMPGGRAGYHSGTSFAAPHVTAILAVEPRETLRRSKTDLLDGLPVIDLGQQGRDPIYGRGLLMAPSQCTPPWETAASNE